MNSEKKLHDASSDAYVDPEILDVLRSAWLLQLRGPRERQRTVRTQSGHLHVEHSKEALQKAYN